MKNVLTNQEDKQMRDYIKAKDNLIWYGRFLESRKLQDNDNSYEEYLKFRVENSKLAIGCFLLYLQEGEQDLAVIDLPNDKLISFGKFTWEYNDSVNGGIHIKNEEQELNIEVNSNTVVRDGDAGSIVIDDKWSLEVW